MSVCEPLEPEEPEEEEQVAMEMKQPGNVKVRRITAAMKCLSIQMK